MEIYYFPIKTSKHIETLLGLKLENRFVPVFFLCFWQPLDQMYEEDTKELSTWQRIAKTN